MSRASEIVNAALGQLGYTEKAKNENLDDDVAGAGSGNFTKYARDLAEAGYYNGNKNGYPWCAVFVDWIFYKTYGKEEGQRIRCQSGKLGASCSYSMGYYREKGRFDEKPMVGDQIFFRYSGNDGADHTGIVTEVNGDTVVTVEGNSDNRVKKNTYARDDKNIVGYGHPMYSEPTEEIIVGSIVEFTENAVRYYPNGARIPEWVKKDYDHIVTQTTVNGRPCIKGGKTCVLLGKKRPKGGGKTVSGIMTWVDVNVLRPASDDAVYTVRKGDTLWSIAKTYLGSGARYTEIVQRNMLKTLTIYPDQKLKIPKK